MPSTPTVAGLPSGPHFYLFSITLHAGPHLSHPSLDAALQPDTSSCCRLPTACSQPTLQSPPKKTSHWEKKTTTTQPTVASPPLNRSAKNAKNVPRHSSLYSHSSQLRSRQAKLCRRSSDGVTTKMCQTEMKAAQHHGDKRQKTELLPFRAEGYVA